MKKVIKFDGAEISYTIQGDGIAVLLLHGFGESSTIWTNLSLSLNKYLLIAPDLPGSGLSQSLTKPQVSLADYAACIATILEHEHIEAVHFIGHSMGGYIALEFASMHQEKLISLTLFHSSAFADDDEKIQTRRKAIEFIQSYGTAPFLETSIPSLFKDADQNKGSIAKLIQDGGSISSKTLVQYYEAMIKRKDHRTLISNLKVPVLFIIGEHDKAVPFNLSLNQCYLPFVSFVRILRSSAHMGMLEQPDEAASIINVFLKEVSKD